MRMRDDDRATDADDQRVEQRLVARRTPDAMVQEIYERLYVGQPLLRVEGLWARGEHYYIVCPDADASTTDVDGTTPLETWLFENTFAMPPIDLVREAPAGARRVTPRPIDHALTLRGTSRISRDLFVDLALALGPAFPGFRFRSRADATEVHVERRLGDAELSTLERALTDLDEPIEFIIVHPSKPAPSPSEPPPFYRAPQGDVTLVPSRALGANVSLAVKRLVEQDEELWMSHRTKALAGREPLAVSSLLPDEEWTGRGLNCVVDATSFPAANIRNYLTLFDTVYLALPLGDGFDDALKQLGTTETELAGVLETGRVKILLPQPIDRYSTAWLSQALEVNAKSIIASRRLACAVIADTRARMPFLHPPLDFDGRRDLMAALHTAASNPGASDDVRRWFRVLARECRDSWEFAAKGVQREGALSTSRSGLGWLVARWHEEFTGHNRVLEIMGAAHVVEWASALGAHAFPKTSADYSEENACRLLAAFYSPLDPRSVPVATPRAHDVLHGILAIDSDAPLVEFATGFRGGDVDRFRELVRTFADATEDERELAAELNRFNAEVKRYESRANRLRTLNIGSAIVAASGEIAPHLPGNLEALRHLPLAVWLLGVLIGLGAEPTSKSSPVGHLLDYANGSLAGTSPKAVLVSRVRQQLKAVDPRP